MSKTRFFGNLIKTNPTLPTANSSSAYGTATGIWTLEEAGAFRASGDWPVPASPPGAPTITGVTAGNAQVAVAFNANADDGGLDVSSSSGQTASGSSSPLTVTSLTNGNAVTFTVTATNASGTSSASSASDSATPVNPPRGIFFGGGSTKYNNSELNNIDYITISSTGNATDFGDISTAREGTGGLSNATRGVCLGGDPGPSDSERVLEYVTIASTGNTTDFGDSAIDLEYGPAGCASPTRGIIFGGSYVPNNTIQYITIGSTGNASDFGDLNFNATAAGAASSNTRALCGRAYSSGGGASPVTAIDYITISSTGNATDFGDQLNDRGGGAGTSSNTRGIFAGGDDDSSGIINVIEYVTIASTGNSQDFGDLTVARVRHGAASSDHGGVQ